MAQNNDNDFLPNFGDIGDFDIPDLDISIFNMEEPENMEEMRYIKPRICRVRDDQVMYDNAMRLAKELHLDKGARADCLVNGSFIFGDFIEAYIKAHNAKCTKMTITTLSMSQENVDSLENLIRGGFVDELNLIVSVYFYSNEIRALVPYIYEHLDIDNKFQLAVAGLHTKTCQFETLGGRKIVMHGSANLRSSGNIEQFTIEENPVLYDWYDEAFENILDKYATIKKPIRHSKLWNEINKMKFND